MPRIEWDKIGEHFYETGVDRVALYSYADGAYKNGVAWNGVSGITENKSGAEDTPIYADNTKYLNMKSLEEYGVTIECYTYPKEFEKCNGMATLAQGAVLGQQAREIFGLSFRTLLGNDILGDSYGYKIHLVYGCSATPSEESNSTVNDSPEAKTLSYEVSTTPVTVTGFRNTSCVTIDSTEVDKEVLKKLEDILYGSESEEARLPLPDELKTILAEG